MTILASSGRRSGRPCMIRATAPPYRCPPQISYLFPPLEMGSGLSGQGQVKKASLCACARTGAYPKLSTFFLWGRDHGEIRPPFSGDFPRECSPSLIFSDFFFSRSLPGIWETTSCPSVNFSLTCGQPLIERPFALFS